MALQWGVLVIWQIVSDLQQSLELKRNIADHLHPNDEHFPTRVKSASINWTSFVEHDSCGCWMSSIFKESDSSPVVIFQLYKKDHGKPGLGSNHCQFQWKWETFNAPHDFTIRYQLPVILQATIHVRIIFLKDQVAYQVPLGYRNLKINALGPSKR